MFCPLGVNNTAGAADKYWIEGGAFLHLSWERRRNVVCLLLFVFCDEAVFFYFPPPFFLTAGTVFMAEEACVHNTLNPGLHLSQLSLQWRSHH